MKKILHLAKYYSPHIGGVETHLREVNKILVKKDYQVTVICFQDNEDQELIEQIDKVTVVRIPVSSFLPKLLSNQSLFINNPFSKLFFKLKLWTWIAKNSKYFLDADIIQVHDVMWWIWPLYMATYYKIYMTFHGWEGRYPVRQRDKLQRYYNSLAAKKSIHVGDFIAQFYLDKPNHVIYGGVNMPKLAKNKSEKLITEKKILSNNSKIVFLGRLEEENEIKKYLSLFKLIKEKFPKVKITFVGDGLYREECEKLGEVTGYIDNPTDYLLDANLVCANSYLSILDAQSYGKVVCSFYSHLLKRSYLENFPGAKLMIIGSKPSDVFKKLLEINRLDNKKLSKEIKKFASKMSWQKIVDIYQEMWEI
ncbi:MAG: glycosyltransferase family 4 protein [Candidatus Pacebacteria bacterium]|nr:glycosyltransferase family 4 protein [Candidatus Paceibacterota bacterium]